MSLPHSPPARCAVTGAGGFIGDQLVLRWLRAGSRPFVALVHREASASALRARGVAAAAVDLLQRRQVLDALRGCDAVVHLAHGDQGPLMTRHVVEAAVAAGVKRFVHVSSMAVHGPAPGADAAVEATARIARYGHDYSDSKAEQEEIVRAAMDRGELAAVILRPTVVYGPGSHFVTLVVDEARSGIVTRIDGGTGLCNPVYVTDVCLAIEAALDEAGAVGEAMFINGDESVTWGEFIAAFAALVEPPPRYNDIASADAMAYWRLNPPDAGRGVWARLARKARALAGRPLRPTPYPPLGRVQREIVKVQFSNEKARRLLRWRPEVGFREGARLTGEWLRSSGHLA